MILQNHNKMDHHCKIKSASMPKKLSIFFIPIIWSLIKTLNDPTNPATSFTSFTKCYYKPCYCSHAEHHQALFLTSYPEFQHSFHTRQFVESFIVAYKCAHSAKDFAYHHFYLHCIKPFSVSFCFSSHTRVFLTKIEITTIKYPYSKKLPNPPTIWIIKVENLFCSFEKA